MNEQPRAIKACGVLVVRGAPVDQFLLMKHKDRLDLPKGHVEDGESETETALRELEEETGIRSGQIDLDPDFRFVTSYDVWPRRFGGELCRKTTVIFLGRLKPEFQDVKVSVSEHPGFRWYSWNPPFALQAETVDPLLAELVQHFECAR